MLSELRIGDSAKPWWGLALFGDGGVVVKGARLGD